MYLDLIEILFTKIIIMDNINVFALKKTTGFHSDVEWFMYVNYTLKWVLN